MVNGQLDVDGAVFLAYTALIEKALANPSMRSYNKLMHHILTTKDLPFDCFLRILRELNFTDPPVPLSEWLVTCVSCIVEEKFDLSMILPTLEPTQRLICIVGSAIKTATQIVHPAEKNRDALLVQAKTLGGQWFTEAQALSINNPSLLVELLKGVSAPDASCEHWVSEFSPHRYWTASGKADISAYILTHTLAPAYQGLVSSATSLYDTHLERCQALLEALTYAHADAQSMCLPNDMG